MIALFWGIIAAIMVFIFPLASLAIVIGIIVWAMFSDY